MAACGRVAALVPCRGGSKRIPRKNVKRIAGRPLLAHILEAARRADCFDATFVATDDEEIAAVARAHGAGVIELDAAQAADDSPIHPVLLTSLDAIEQRLAPPQPAQGEDAGGSLAALCYLRATSPLVQPSHIRAAVGALLAAPPEADSVLAVAQLAGAHPSRFKRVDPVSGYLADAFPEHFAEAHVPCRSETLTCLQRSGAVQVLRPEALRRGSLWGPRCLPLVLPEEASIDINTPLDWDFAEFLLLRRRGGGAGADPGQEA